MVLARSCARDYFRSAPEAGNKTLESCSGRWCFGIADAVVEPKPFCRSGHCAVLQPLHPVRFGAAGNIPNPHGGLNIVAGNRNVLLPGGTANQSGGLLYALPVTRGAGGHITGFGSPAIPRNPALCCRSRPVFRWWFAASGRSSADGPNFSPLGIYSPGFFLLRSAKTRGTGFLCLGSLS